MQVINAKLYSNTIKVSLGFETIFCFIQICVFLQRKMMRKLAKNAILELRRLFSQNTLKSYLLLEYCFDWPQIWSKWRFYGAASCYGADFYILFFFAKLWPFVLLMHGIFIFLPNVRSTNGHNLQNKIWGWFFISCFFAKLWPFVLLMHGMFIFLPNVRSTNGHNLLNKI